MNGGGRNLAKEMKKTENNGERNGVIPQRRKIENQAA